MGEEQSSKTPPDVSVLYLWRNVNQRLLLKCFSFVCSESKTNLEAFVKMFQFCVHIERKTNLETSVRAPSKPDYTMPLRWNCVLEVMQARRNINFSKNLFLLTRELIPWLCPPERMSQNDKGLSESCIVAVIPRIYSYDLNASHNKGSICIPLRLSPIPEFYGLQKLDIFIQGYCDNYLPV